MACGQPTSSKPPAKSYPKPLQTASMEALIKYDKGPGHVALMEVPEPRCENHQVILEVNCCGICGTDLHVYNDTFRNYPPVILGHEFAGKIVEIGSDVSGINRSDSFAV